MKPRAIKLLVVTAACACLSAGTLAVSSAQVNDPAASPTATPSPKAADNGKVKKPKAPKDTGDPTLPPKRKAKEIPFPVPVGKDANVIKVPSYDQVGKVLSVLQAAKATRIDNEHVQLEGMTFDLSGTNDGKDAYKVEMPTSVLDLKTNIVTSDHAVTIRTKDFDLTGEKVEFNTVERSGELRGRVHMVIHNLKQVATPGQPSADPQ